MLKLDTGESLCQQSETTALCYTCIQNSNICLVFFPLKTWWQAVKLHPKCIINKEFHNVVLWFAYLEPFNKVFALFLAWALARSSQCSTLKCKIHVSVSAVKNYKYRVSYFTTSVCSVVLQQIQLEPLNATVLQGADVQFRASVEGAWEVMTWNVGGLLVLTILTHTNISSSPERFSATFCSNGDTGCVDFIIRNVTRKESGPVVCTVQGEQGSKAAQLNVQGEVMKTYVIDC